MKFLLIEYSTPLKQDIINKLYFDSKQQIQEYLGISKNTLDNFIYGFRVKGKRKSISILSKIDIYRKYAYDCKSLESIYKQGIEDIEEILRYVKKNLKQVTE